MVRRSVSDEIEVSAAKVVQVVNILRVRALIGLALSEVYRCILGGAWEMSGLASLVFVSVAPNVSIVLPRCSIDYISMATLRTFSFEPALKAL
jgi:hypothetical protein